MRFKIDENLHVDAAEFLRQQGFDAMTVGEQGLSGQADNVIAQVCQHEKRVLVTLDLDFADMRSYPPNQYSGLLVLRLTDQSRPSVLRTLARILPFFQAEKLIGQLWIVDDNKLRIRAA
ncbi:MAG: DUF5615 family PIN-like protein [Proteobacteria bacterium]|nr:DUF5615 family PIN-like protein [Pseudomonadota bacterium]